MVKIKELFWMVVILMNDASNAIAQIGADVQIEGDALANSSLYIGIVVEVFDHTESFF